MNAPPDTTWMLETENSADEARVWLTGEKVRLGEADAERVEDQLSRVVEESGRSRLLLDLGNVTFLTSRALGVFLRLHRQLHGTGGGLTLANVQPQIYEIFEITSLTRVLDVRAAEAKRCPA